MVESAAKQDLANASAIFKKVDGDCFLLLHLPICCTSHSFLSLSCCLICVFSTQQWCCRFSFELKCVEFVVPKIYIKMEYCVSCAIHSHVVRVRAKAERRNREPPQRYQPQRRTRQRVKRQVAPAPEILVEGSKAVGRSIPVATQQQ
jgi:hypothetical protein